MEIHQWLLMGVQNAVLARKLIVFIPHSPSRALYKEDMVSMILNDTLAENCEQLRLSPKLPNSMSRVLRDLLIHFYITRRDTPTATLLDPFKNLIHKPAKMKDSYLPTMPQDTDFEALQAIVDTDEYTKMYACPNGHMYAITECGRPNARRKCPECKAPIGSSGRMHQIAEGNTLKSLEDTTKKGFILDRVTDASAVLLPERKLSLLQANVIRLLLHLSLYLGANRDMKGVCSLIDPSIPEGDVADFLWNHLRDDLRALTQTFSIDDAVILIHTIIIKMAEFRDQTTDMPDTLLTAKASRCEWEDRFISSIIGPILNGKDEIIQAGHQKILDDDNLGIKKLLEMVHEVNNDGVMAIMWRYRVQVTFERAAEKLAELRCSNEQAVTTHQHELLHYFMQNEYNLRDVKILPRIIEFHKLLLKKYDHKITQNKAKKTSVGNFLKSKGYTNLEGLYNDYEEVSDIVERHQSGKGMKESRCRKINRKTSLSTFLPKSEILETLVSIHNKLIEYLEKANCNLGPDVNLLDVKPTHLVTYNPDKDLLPLVTANCSSSLKLGEGTKIKYDFDKMEHQLIEYLFEGKSKIVKTNIPMVFSDSLTAMSKLEKLAIKIPQEPFTSEVELDLYKDAHFASDVYDLVANLDTAISFLHTVGGDPGRSLEAFMKEDLRMDPVPLPTRSQNHCKLQHIRALWLFMSNEREKHAAKADSEFSTLPEDQCCSIRDPLKPEQKEALYLKLEHADLNRLLLEIFTCIMLKIVPLEDSCSVDTPLIYFLTEMEESQLAAGAMALPDKVPPIRVSQCMAAWKEICIYNQE